MKSQNEQTKRVLSEDEKRRLVEIQTMLDAQLRVELNKSDVSKYADNIADASLALLDIQNILAEKTSEILFALKAMCVAQDDIERAMIKNFAQNPSLLASFAGKPRVSALDALVNRIKNKKIIR